MNIDRYAPGESVRVRYPGDPHYNETGTVDHTYADCGDMMHVVAFTDRTRATYYADELRGLHTKPQPTQGNT